MVEGPQFGAPDEEAIVALNAFYKSNPIDRGRLKREIQEVLSRLTERERIVLRLRFGLEEYLKKGMTQAEVGKDPRIKRSRWTVGRVERDALAKLRTPVTP